MERRFVLVILSCATCGAVVATDPPRLTPNGMVWIAGGEFTMGSEDERSRRNEQPAHRGSVDGFFMDEHDVTNAEFAKFVEATGYVTIAERNPDWEEIKKQVPPGRPKPDASPLVPGAFPYQNTQEDGFAGTSPVKSFPPNSYGLYDMGGNVWNWCSDWYRPNTHVQLAKEPTCHNPQGLATSWSPDHPFQSERVTKGGSSLCHVDYCESYRVSARRGTPPDTGMSHIGFRCVLSGHQGAPAH